MYHQITIEEALQQIQQDETVFCRRCGRKLKSEQAKQLGFGPTCYSRYIKETSTNRKKLFVVSNGEKQ